jgi:hypothetical protein
MLRSCVLQGTKRTEKGSRNWRKAESENISLYATLQEPEFRCFTQLISSLTFENSLHMPTIKHIITGWARYRSQSTNNFN